MVCRREIRDLDEKDTKRFLSAVNQMMVDSAGPQSSEFFRLAGYHGWPNDYCHHAQETFPTWHRAFLVAFEQALQVADYQLGGDGNIALPYWDWTKEDKNGNLFPTVCAKFTLPDQFIKDDNNLKNRNMTKRKSPEVIEATLRNNKLQTLVDKCLNESEYWKHASAEHQGWSVEVPHNSVHVAIGFPMSSVQFAAFDLTFWLHHCNVDRIHEKYLQVERDSEVEFKTHQDFLTREAKENGKTPKNKFEDTLEPFKHPFTGNPIYPKDCFHTEHIGYQYDVLPSFSPPDEKNQMRQAKVFLTFANVDMNAFSLTSYMLHAFLKPLESKEEVKIDLAHPENFAELKEYGGCVAIFGSKGIKCKNCETRKPVCLRIDISDALIRLEKSRYEVEVEIVAIPEDEDTHFKLEFKDDKCVQLPLRRCKIVGESIFEDTQVLKQVSCPDGITHRDRGQVLQIQNILKSFGYYEGECDGWWGPKTESALETFKGYVGIKGKEEGAGAITKASLARDRFDAHRDELTDDNDKKFFDLSTKTFNYSVGVSPGYLNRAQVLKETQAAFDGWGEALGIKFCLKGLRDTEDLGDKSSTDTIHIAWFHKSGEQSEYTFGARGGTLAHTTPEARLIQLDITERWLLMTQKQEYKYGRFFYQPVLAHEIGHLLGLSHSDVPEDLMAPFYDHDKLALAPMDITRLKTLYGL